MFAKEHLSAARRRLVSVIALVGVVATTFAGIPNAAAAAEDGGVRSLLYARPFTLEEPYTYVYTKEQPEISRGYILVLEVDPQRAQPRQTDMPVLFVGSRPAELTNRGDKSGRIIVLVPGDTVLSESPLFYGTTELPERIDQAQAVQQRDLALEIGVQPRPATEIESAFDKGGDTLAVRQIDDVYRELADLIEEYSPEESDLIEAYRMIPSRP